MTRQKNDTQNENESQSTFEAMVREQLQQAVRTALISVLEAEVDAFIGAVGYELSRAEAGLPQRSYQRSAHAAHTSRLSDTTV
jgi:hypothetical protein